MKVIILQPTIMGGTDFQPAPHAQEVSDTVGNHLIEIGSARLFETKVAEVTEKKTSSSSQAAPASRKRTATKRKPRKPKS